MLSSFTAIGLFQFFRSSVSASISTLTPASTSAQNAVSGSTPTPTPTPMPTPTPVPSSVEGVKLVSVEKKVVDVKVEAKKIALIKRARQKLRVQALDEKKASHFNSPLLGNDPPILGLESYLPEGESKHQKVVLIATAGLRALLLACQLGANNKNIIPGIILIDICLTKKKLWKGLRSYAVNKDKKAFFAGLEDFCLKDLGLSKESKESRARKISDIKLFFTDLFKQYEYKYVIAILTETKFILQNWLDTTLFAKLKIVIKALGARNVYVYASNIRDFLHEETLKLAFFRNIALIKPRLCIHTEDENIQGYFKFFLIEDAKKIKEISKLFGQQPLVQDGYSGDDQALEDLIRELNSPDDDPLLKKEDAHGSSGSSGSPSLDGVEADGEISGCVSPLSNVSRSVSPFDDKDAKHDIQFTSIKKQTSYQVGLWFGHPVYLVQDEQTQKCTQGLVYYKRSG